jgi:hypothetical protein
MSTRYPDIRSTNAWSPQARKGQDQSDGTPLIDTPVINASIGARADVYGPTMDDYRLRVAQGSMGSLL